MSYQFYVQSGGKCPVTLRRSNKNLLVLPVVKLTGGFEYRPLPNLSDAHTR